MRNKTGKYNLQIIFIPLILFMSVPFLVTGRSFLGLYIFNFRIGELLTGFSFVLILFVISNLKKFNKELNSKFLFLNFLLIIYFIFIGIFNESSFFNLYIYKSSVFIWYTAFFYLGYMISKNRNFNFNFIIFGYFILFIQYLFSTFFYPDLLIKFFEKYADKFQFMKASELIIVFIFVSFLGNRYGRDSFFEIFFLSSSLFIPLLIFKSRGSGIAVIIYFLLEVFRYKKYFFFNKKRSIALVFIFVILFSISANFLIGTDFVIEDTDSDVAELFLYRFEAGNSFNNELSLFFIDKGRLYSSDGNLNWRFQIWQQIYEDNKNSERLIFGQGFNERLKVFDIKVFTGLDGSNENPHNFIMNIFGRIGFLGLIIYFYFFYELLKLFQKKIINLMFYTFFHQFYLFHYLTHLLKIHILEYYFLSF